MVNCTAIFVKLHRYTKTVLYIIWIGYDWRRCSEAISTHTLFHSSLFDRNGFECPEKWQKMWYCPFSERSFKKISSFFFFCCLFHVLWKWEWVRIREVGQAKKLFTFLLQIFNNFEGFKVVCALIGALNLTQIHVM